MDYGYCLTVHKSQGSQYPTVTLYDDGFGKREPETRRRWLYTAITRAENQLYIVTS
jgi:exodeoxyribonuclease-5